MDTVGFCTIKSDAKSGVSPDVKSFLGKDCRVMEFASDDGVLVINNEATAIGMFDKEDVLRKFECSVVGDVIVPPGLSLVDQIMYVGKVTTRKGGYVPLLRNMVIEASLMKGVLTDGFLFQNVDEHFNII